MGPAGRVRHRSASETLAGFPFAPVTAAIVNFAVQSNGSVSDVEVNAPAFKGTNLPNCVGDQVKKMTFPKFQQGPQSVSYPFVFVGS